jgi:hypothetical protein
MAKIHTLTQAHEIIYKHTHEIMDHSTQAHCLAKVFLFPLSTRIAIYFPKTFCSSKNSTRGHTRKLLRCTTHQRWNQSKIIILQSTINKTRQKTNNTKIITAGNAQLLK